MPKVLRRHKGCSVWLYFQHALCSDWFGHRLGVGKGSEGGLGLSSCTLHTGPRDEKDCWDTLGNTGGTAPAVGRFEKEISCMTQTRTDHSAHKRCLPSTVEKLPTSHLETLGQASSCSVLQFLLLGGGTISL